MDEFFRFDFEHEINIARMQNGRCEEKEVKQCIPYKIVIEQLFIFSLFKKCSVSEFVECIRILYT